MKVVVLRGISGSGKSTLARSRANMLSKGVGRKVAIVGADLIMEELHRGEFVKTSLHRCHIICFKRFLDILMEGETDTIFVDNTNTRVQEASPYVIASEAYGAEVEVITLVCPPEEAWERSRNVNDASVILDQYTRLMSEPTPPYWKRETVFTHDT